MLDSLPCDPSLLPVDMVTFIPPNKAQFKNTIIQDSAELCFNVLLSSRLKTKYQTRSSLENSDNPIPKNIIFNDSAAKNKASESQLFTNGSVSRGLTSGNNQGFLINSDLNLQMQGNLGKGVRLTAAVSDNNSPLQPDGTTLKVQDFDRVFIKVDKDSWFAIAGDYFMQSSKDNYFMAFNKKSRGLQFEGIYNLNSETKLRLGTNAAVSRGRFSRNEIQGQEGLQGPYRLSGSQNEAFIIVIAATEVIYVDGKQLKRGQQNDYVINYNTAEVIFNPNILITQYSRIVVEFQYADQNYSRVLFNQSLAVEKEKINLRFNYFIEQDNKNQPFQAEDELSLFDSVNNIDAKQVLAAAGDNESSAVMSTVRIEESFDPNKILYKLIDSLGFFDVLRYSPTAEGGPYFSAIFSNVGQGQGNYVQSNTAANGRVYSWVAPINGVPQGSFEPVIQLVAPNRQQMATVAMDYKFSSKTKMSAELAYSQFDANTFSVLNKDNDDALGSFVNLEDKRKLGSKDWSNTIKWERVSRNFSFVERYRSVEFDRVWNRSLTNPELQRQAEQEQILNLAGSIADSFNSYKYGLASYQRGRSFSGLSPNWDISKRVSKKLSLNTSGNYMQSNLLDSLGTKAYESFSEMNIILPQSGVFRLYGELVSNSINLNNKDSFLGNSFQFQRYGTGLNLKLKRNWLVNSSAEMRTDWLPVENRFVWSSDGLNIKNEIRRQKGTTRFALISSLRFLFQNRQFFNESREQFLQQRLEYSNNNYSRGYRLNFFLQSGTGREQRREFVFLEVPAGQGQYAWNDYNLNGIKEINEFELSVFQDQARYIKVYNLTNDFVNANLHEGNLSLRLMPSKWFKKSKPWLQNLSNQFNLRLLQQNNSNSLLVLNPFVQDTQILSGNTLLRNSLLYNAPQFGAELTFKRSEAKQLLTFGSENIISENYIAKARYNYKSNWQVDVTNRLESRALINPFFDNRNYSWQGNNSELSISWQNQNSRLSLKGGYVLGSGEEFGTDSIKERTIELGLQYFLNISDETNLDISLSRNQVTFNGSSNSPLGFQILNGQTEGTNLLWNLNLRTLVSKNIQMTIGYEGRSIPGLPIVHIGRAEARYLF